MKNIEIIVVDKYNSNKILESYEINYSDERSKKLGNLEGCVKLSDNEEKTIFLYKDNKMKGIILYRGHIKPYQTEDWINTFSKK